MSSRRSSDDTPQQRGGHDRPADADDEEAMLREALRRSLADVTTTSAAAHATATGGGSSPKRRRRDDDDGTSASQRMKEAPVLISLLSDDEGDVEDEGGELKAAAASTSMARRASSSLRSVDDEVEIVAPEAPRLETVTRGDGSNGRQDGNDDEIDVLDATNVTRLPHMRQHCTECRFVRDVNLSCTSASKSWVLAKHSADLKVNETCCSLCYCYVCDAPASSCTQWDSTRDVEAGWPFMPHCIASDGGMHGSIWKGLRQSKKQTGRTTVGTGRDASTANGTAGTVHLVGGSSAPTPGPAHTGAVVRLEGPSNMQRLVEQMYGTASRHAAMLTSATTSVSGAPVPLVAGSSIPGLTSGGAAPGAGSRSDVQRLLEQLYGTTSSTAAVSALATTSASASYQALNIAARSNPSPRLPSSSGVGTGHSASSGHSGPSSSSTRSPDPIAPGSGPFPPNHSGARGCSTLTKCRRCNWYNNFQHCNFTKPMSYDSQKRQYVQKVKYASSYDWCHYCGRVASSKDFEKEQAQGSTYRQTGVEVSLGNKNISFRIRSHDPRNFDEFAANWRKESSTWTYSREEMDEDTFMHRIGRYPRSEGILSMIPIQSESRIPKRGVVTSDCSKHERPTGHEKMPSASETEAILLESQNHRSLFEELHYFGINPDGNSRSKESDVLGGHVTAHWDARKRKGTFVVSLFLKKGAFIEHGRTGREEEGEASLSRILGVWFNVLPFQLRDLTALAAEIPPDSYRRAIANGTFAFPLVKSDEARARLTAISKRERYAVTTYNRAASQRRKSVRSFVSSTNSSSGGGICSNDVSFEGTLKRYFSETLAEDTERTHGCDNIYAKGYRLSWPVRMMGGPIAHHRDECRGSAVPGRHDDIAPFTGFRSYVQDEDHALLVGNLRKGTHAIFKRTKTFSGLMQQLENLGHASAPRAEGLNVELLDYQRQAVGWAIERENVGVQNFLWTELPLQNATEKIYFSPVLNAVSRTPPKRVRGGMICEEMGLGKTVISLAIILQNPAPAVPKSGDKVVASTTPPGWSKPERSASATIDAGSIYSRGTLVICNVSLVGQWVDEAKSKLKNPGMVYSYHGPKRNKNAATLAENAIVVTTYQTLASDMRIAAGDYCPPCEMVRWWRVICDESHYLRNENSLISKSASRLAAESRWCVTGTPINMYLKDLKNQLAFVGLEHVEALFKTFSPLWTSHTDNPPITGRQFRSSISYDGRAESPFGAFLFVMRNVMIRHSMAMKNRRTASDIMSLPARKETMRYVSFSDNERAEYTKLERAALAAYGMIRRESEVHFNKRFLRLFQTLMPLRMACSGGPVFLKGNNNDGEGGRAPYEMTDEDATECSICLNLFNDAQATDCNHVFCKECIEGVIGVHDEASAPCPICRNQVRKSSLRKALLPTFAQLPEVSGEDAAHLAFRSKFAVLLEELKTIRDSEPGAKSLVFSQFASTLTWMQKELPKHGFQFRTLSGDMTMTKRAKALRDFQNDPPTTIFLLSMRAGAVGINLTQANRVFIMEPALNPALEAQAIGRVHRLGQTKRVEIVRLVMRDSFETRLLDVVGGHGGMSGSGSGGDSAAGAPNDPTAKSPNNRRQSGGDAGGSDGLGDEEKENVGISNSNSNGTGKNNALRGTKPAVVANAAKANSASSSHAIVGSLRRDNVKFGRVEFDVLYGWAG